MRKVYLDVTGAHRRCQNGLSINLLSSLFTHSVRAKGEVT